MSKVKLKIKFNYTNEVADKIKEAIKLLQETQLISTARISKEKEQSSGTLEFITYDVIKLDYAKSIDFT